MKKLLLAAMALSVISINVYAKEKWQLKSVLSSSSFQPGRSWTYKVLFVGSQNDTTDAITAKLEILKEDTFLHTQPSEWRYSNTSEPAKVVGNELLFKISPPAGGKFEPLNLYIPAYCMKKLDTVNVMRKLSQAEIMAREAAAKKPLTVHSEEIVDTSRPDTTKPDITKPDTTKKDSIIGKEFESWELNVGVIKGELLVINYFPQFERKTVTALMQPIPECLEIKAERKKLKLVETVRKEDLKATFYFHDKYGFVRWEYLKPDGSRVIFDLQQVSGI